MEEIIKIVLGSLCCISLLLGGLDLAQGEGEGEDFVEAREEGYDPFDSGVHGGGRVHGTSGTSRDSKGHRPLRNRPPSRKEFSREKRRSFSPGRGSNSPEITFLRSGKKLKGGHPSFKEQRRQLLERREKALKHLEEY